MEILYGYPRFVTLSFCDNVTASQRVKRYFAPSDLELSCTLTSLCRIYDLLSSVSYNNIKTSRQEKNMFQNISMRQLEGILDAGGNHYILVDVRENEEYRRGHLEGAVNLPYEELFRAPELLSKDKIILVYCAHGSNSMLAARELSGMGYRTVNVYGGLMYYRGRHMTVD